ncbi:hypothetical protein IWZ03DRAFT_7402 [Phyllosticta citriasiana]|uniref:Secreted protein n=1 Tax=Phyllosticta citriasiana TaxID=595635 RepID=A0ABR1KXM1_9PEZI
MLLMLMLMLMLMLLPPPRRIRREGICPAMPSSVPLAIFLLVSGLGARRGHIPALHEHISVGQSWSDRGMISNRRAMD